MILRCNVVISCFLPSCFNDPLTRPAPAGESASRGHPLPQGGDGRVSISFVAALQRGVVGQFDVEAALRRHMAR